MDVLIIGPPALCAAFMAIWLILAMEFAKPFEVRKSDRG